MYSIGEFSKITGLTVKTLRFYHERGLLVPSCVDDRTGYRYYDAAKVEAARVITALRRLEFPLEEIAAVLTGCGDDADALGVLERQRDVLAARVHHLRDVLTSLNQIISKEREARMAMQTSAFRVEERVLGPVLVAGIRMRGRDADCGAAFSRIGRRLGRHVCGKPLLLHYDAEYKEVDADFEACMPVRRGVDTEDISVRELPGGRCVALLHQGPYDELGRSYAAVLAYARERGLTVQLPTREVYVKGPGMIFRGNPRKYLTEIQLLVE